jgi:hypothetical protein
MYKQSTPYVVGNKNQYKKHTTHTIREKTKALT